MYQRRGGGGGRRERRARAHRGGNCSPAVVPGFISRAPWFPGFSLNPKSSGGGLVWQQDCEDPNPPSPALFVEGSGFIGFRV